MSKQRLERLAKKLGCAIEFAPMWDITAPANHCFASNPGCHYIVFEPLSGVTMREVYQDAWNRLSTGLLECHCGDCEP